MLSCMGAQGSKKPRLKLPLKARPRTNNVFTAQIQGLEKQSPPLDRTCVKKFAAIFNLTQRPPQKIGSVYEQSIYIKGNTNGVQTYEKLPNFTHKTNANYTTLRKHFPPLDWQR